MSDFSSQCPFQESAAEMDLAMHFAGDIQNSDVASKIRPATNCTNEVFLCSKKWVFKPQPPLGNGLGPGKSSREGISPRREYLREIAAFHLDRLNGSFAGVPTTVGVSVPPSTTALLRTLCAGSASPYVNTTQADNIDGSVQAWIEHRCCSEDMGPSRFSTADVHRIGLLDIRLFNTDRHAGNLLVTSNDRLVPIDHGLCLPDIWCGLGQAEFAWLFWKQAKQPFSKSTMQWVANLNTQRDAQVLRSLGFPDPCILTLCFCTEVLKFAVLELGWNLNRIGLFFTRMFGAHASKLEDLVREAHSKWGKQFLRIVWNKSAFWTSDFRSFIRETLS